MVLVLDMVVGVSPAAGVVIGIAEEVGVVVGGGVVILGGVVPLAASNSMAASYSTAVNSLVISSTCHRSSQSLPRTLCLSYLVTVFVSA